jgi:hypothetical protein
VTPAHRAGRIARAVLVALLPIAAPVGAATLEVGPGARFRVPSEAAAAARDGDTVRIAPGRYADCTVWRAARLTIVATGPVEISGPVCAGKALFVIGGTGTVVEGITFRGAVAPDGNGAGIRAEGGDLVIRRSRFEGNESGLLTRVDMTTSRIVIEDSVFAGNGAMRGAVCTGHALYANQLAALVIRRSRFEATRGCHHVKSRAARTEITGSVLTDDETAGSSYLVDIPNGGDLLLEDNLLVKGPRTGNPRTAVMIGAEGVRWPTRSLVIRANRFDSRLTLPTVFVENRSATPALLEANVIRGRAAPLIGPGEVR